MNRFPNEMPSDVVAALERGRKIEAIKLLRERRGLGLKEAKEAVELYTREHPHLHGSRALAGGSSHGLLFWVLLSLALGLVLLLFSDRL
ncbi:50S ribosomal protein L7/L12 [Pseudomonas sp. CrR25]|nr:50S ribosomal protein L7/L12 [Pseudomonas sp. CrR25]